MDSLIEEIKSYISLSSKDEELIRNLFHKRIIQKNEHLLKAGQTCKHLFFIEQGLVRYYSFTNNEEQTNYFNKEGEWVCDYPSFIPKMPTTVYIQALEPTTVWAVSFDDLQIFYKKIKYGERYGRLSIEQVFINIIRQTISLYTDKPEVRYEKFISTYFDIAQRIPQYYIASYIGVKPQSLSRIRKKMSDRP